MYLQYSIAIELRLYTCSSLCYFAAFALALSALYENECEMNVSEADVVGVLAAASFLGFTALEKL